MCGARMDVLTNIAHHVVSPAPCSGCATDTGVVRCTIETALGTIDVELDTASAPLTCANFLAYVDAGAYEGGAFTRAVRMDNQAHDGHRSPEKSVRIEVVQFGQSVDAATLAPIPMESTEDTGLTHVDGTLSMARGAPDSATSSV